MFPIELVKFKLMRPGASLPTRATNGSGGFDFFAPEDGFLDPSEKQLLPSGVAHEMPGTLFLKTVTELGHGFCAQEVLIPFQLQGILFDRSGLGGKKGIKLSFHGLIDNDYRGEILLSIVNNSPNPFAWVKGDRLCQIGYALMYSGQSALTETLDVTKRGDGGFGSTGK